MGALAANYEKDAGCVQAAITLAGVLREVGEAATAARPGTRFSVYVSGSTAGLDVYPLGDAEEVLALTDETGRDFRMKALE